MRCFRRGLVYFLLFDLFLTVDELSDFAALYNQRLSGSSIVMMCYLVLPALNILLCMYNIQICK